MRVLGRIAEGGQVWAHRVRMLRQVFKLALLISLILGVAYLFVGIKNVEPHVLPSLWYSAKARFAAAVGNGSITVDPSHWSQIDRYQSLPNPPVINSARALRVTQPHVESFLSWLVQRLWKTGGVAIVSFSGVLLLFLIRGGLSGKKEVVAGKKVVSVWKLRLSLKISRKASHLSLGRLPLVRGAETQHVLVTGGTGSGKTNCFHHLMPEIRRIGQRAVVVDTTGSFIERYYQPGDIILHPTDKRGKPWHPWAECRDRFDRDSLCEGLIPVSTHDQENYWRSAARTLLSSLLEKLEKTPRTSNLTRWVLYKPLEDLCSYVQGTRAASVIDFASEKTSASVRSVAATFMECFDHLQDTEDSFSIRDWVLGEEDGSWLFLSCAPPQRSSFRPLIGCWASMVVRALLHHVPDFRRRLWLIIDELPTMHRIKDLESFLTEGRKYGGCGLFAVQSPAQLEVLYGRETSQILMGNCATKIVFSERDPEIARRISSAFGQYEVKEYQEGLSYGAHEMRDGVSLSKVSRQKPVVSATDIQSLKNNQAYVRLPGNYPVTKIKLNLVRT